MKLATTTFLALLCSTSSNALNHGLKFIIDTRDADNTTLTAASGPLEKHRLFRRADWDTAPDISDELWNKARCRGRALAQAMSLSDQNAGALYTPPIPSVQTPWRGDLRQALYTWGYQEHAMTVRECDFGEDLYGRSWAEALRQLGIGTRPYVDNWCYFFTHGHNGIVDDQGQGIPLREQVYDVGGHEYQATGAFVKFAVNDAAGAMFVRSSWGPAQAFHNLFGRPAASNELPALRALSDYLWSDWIRGSQPSTRYNPNVANLNHLFSVWVTNPESLGIMKRALASRGKNKPSLWPGDDFDVSTAEGQAILGSPNGKRWGYMVNQRKLDMGVRYIYNARIFIGDVADLPTILFSVRGVANPGQGDVNSFGNQPNFNVSAFIAQTAENHEAGGSELNEGEKNASGAIEAAVGSRERNLQRSHNIVDMHGGLKDIVYRV